MDDNRSVVPLPWLGLFAGIFLAHEWLQHGFWGFCLAIILGMAGYWLVLGRSLFTGIARGDIDLTDHVARFQERARRMHGRF